MYGYALEHKVRNGLQLAPNTAIEEDIILQYDIRAIYRKEAKAAIPRYTIGNINILTTVQAKSCIKFIIPIPRKGTGCILNPDIAGGVVEQDARAALICINLEIMDDMGTFPG